MPRPAPERAPVHGTVARALDEAAGYALLDRLGVPRAQSAVLPVDGVDQPALPFAYPVVVKALSAEATHKTELGGVVLNVSGVDALIAAIKTVRDNAGRHGIALDRALVQRVQCLLE